MMIQEAAASMVSPIENTLAGVCSTAADQSGAAGLREMSPSEFRKISSENGIQLRGLAGAHAEHQHALAFFAANQDPHHDEPTLIPNSRIEKICVLDELPVENSPLQMPSLWRVLIHIAPAPTKNVQLNTVFESD